jgi:hypothetical protein
MAEATAEGGIVTDPLRPVSLGPTEGSTASDEITLNPKEGERQAWWPEGVNSEAELQAFVSGLTKPQAPTDGAPLDPEAAPKPATEEPAAKAATEEPAKARTDDEIRESLKAAGGVYADPKYEPFALEVEKTGALSEASIAKAATDFNVPPEYVKAFVDGQLAARALETAKVQTTQTEALRKVAIAIKTVFPGEEGNKQYEDFIAWGSKDGNLTNEERLAYDSAMDRGDTPTMQVLLANFRTRFMSEGDTTTRREITNSGAQQPAAQASTAVTPFASLSEGRAAMASRRYKTDAAYRQSVDARYVITP